ncbi:MAG: DUF885 domain-containing protein [Parafilimonas sp.]
MKYSYCIFLATIVATNSNTNKNEPTRFAAINADILFAAFENRFIDAYWKQNPSAAIYAGYGKYYDDLKIPDSTAFAGDVGFAKDYLDSLQTFHFDELSANNKIDYRILENQLRGTIWYTDTFKIQEWDPSGYNLGGECYEIINKNFAPLTERLKILSNHLQHADAYYAAALSVIHQPTREHTELAVLQNEGSLDVFGNMLADSIKVSLLTVEEKDTLMKRIAVTKNAIKNYVNELKKITGDKNYAFRSYRIGDTLFNQKFQYDIVTDFSAKEIFDNAVAAKKTYHTEMYRLGTELWTKYFFNQSKPVDTLLMIKMIIDKIALNHVSPEHLIDTINQQVHDLERFIIQKNLFAYDTASPLKVRIMPAYMSGATVASASLTGPYDKNAVAYYNISDLKKIPRGKAESQLREYNNYTLQILSIHEAMPGHCMQGVYSNKSTSIIKAVFGNGAMIEGWAVYTQRMMLENGWANNSPEMWLMFYKWSLRECCNVIVDYGIHCLNYSKDEVVKLLKNQAFQEDAQIEEKYHRATISQVQLCSYFTGATEILALRDAIKRKEGKNFSLKDFHERFLSYGSAPVKYISELMPGK